MLKKLFLGTSLLLLFLFFAGTVFAQNTQTPTTLRDLKNLRSTNSSLLRQNLMEKRREFLEGKRLQTCRIYAKNIQRRSSKIRERAENMVRRFDRISEAVQKYYTDKLVPQGKTLSNYNALISDINAKKAALSPLVEEARADAAAFSCDGEDPRGQLTTFKEDMKAIIAGLKEYRRSVRNLIVAVRGLQGRGGTATPSAVPTGAL